MASNSYIIVGAGVFGTSTALHLITKFPHSSVTLIDRDAPDAQTRVAASWDWNKVVRADYRDPLYCKLALEARDVWREDPLWSPFYHETGVYWISRTGFAKEVIDNYERLGRKTEGALYALPVEEARKRYGGIFEDADYTGVENVLVNTTSGWADAKGALRAVTERAVQLGVKFVKAEIDGLEFGTEGECVGARTKDGERYTATHTILSTGSFTPKLLEGVANSTGRDTFLAGGRIISAGVTTGLAQLDDETAKEYAQMPVCIQENPPERGADNGSLPLTEDKKLKWWGQCIFKNTQAMPSGRHISAPPAGADYSQWKIPEFLVEDVDLSNKAIFGKRGEVWKTTSHRVCWEALTPSKDFIISPHSASRGLYVATCGSFHGWKFFPAIGSYVVRMLEGTLEPDLIKRWAWDRELPDVSGNKVWPLKELREL
ncbi:FAD dependent oxidoreductase [Hypoxylon trugodes]|uniref:FAD dependent oxidoreductase n=1 Tax=Hypoxylon trugodes TaxID=326681 RepID=UPI00218CD86D|nr:FAD dependent oxidoreductase [Hypoxylon trugodes]KAI1392476.1 FAD dependent oxidoreductase [Hypoxylon trugodes]